MAVSGSIFLIFKKIYTKTLRNSTRRPFMFKHTGFKDKKNNSSSLLGVTFALTEVDPLTAFNYSLAHPVQFNRENEDTRVAS